MDRLNLNEKSILDTFSLFPAEAELIQKKNFYDNKSRNWRLSLKPQNALDQL